MAAPAYRSGANASATLGNQASVSLAGASTDDLMILFALSGGTIPIADPAGWTRISRDSVGALGYWIGYRVKQGGDTAVLIGGGGIGQSAAVCGFYFGDAIAFGEIGAVVSGAAGSTTIDPAAVTIDNVNSLSVIGVGGLVGGSTITAPTNWTGRDANTAVATIRLMDQGPLLSAGSLDPGNATYSASNTDRLAYHIEIKGAIISGGAMLLGVG